MIAYNRSFDLQESFHPICLAFSEDKQRTIALVETAHRTYIFLPFRVDRLKRLLLSKNLSVESIAQELEAKNYRLEEWRDKGLAAIDSGLNKRKGDPMPGLDASMKRIGELINVPIIVLTHPK